MFRQAREPTYLNVQDILRAPVPSGPSDHLQQSSGNERHQNEPVIRLTPGNRRIVNGQTHVSAPFNAVVDRL